MVAVDLPFLNTSLSFSYTKKVNVLDLKCLERLFFFCVLYSKCLYGESFNCTTLSTVVLIVYCVLLPTVLPGQVEFPGSSTSRRRRRGTAATGCSSPSSLQPHAHTTCLSQTQE